MLLLMAWVGMMVEGVALNAKLVWYVLTPMSAMFGIFIAYRWWQSFRAKRYIYRDKAGDEVQDEPYVAFFRAVLLAGMMAVATWGILQGALRFAVQFTSTTPFTFAGVVAGLASGRNCRVDVQYEDPFTSGRAHSCATYAPGQRWVGEPITVHELTGPLGSKLIRIVYDDRAENAK